MYFSEARLSRDSALEVASAVNHFVQNNIDDKYFLIVTIDAHSNLDEIFVRPMVGQDFIPSADGSQIIRCMAEDGRRVDLIIPRPELRRTHGASVIVGEHPS